jgi:glycosyltransferase involved in cell wall biosynthesis
VSYGKSPPGGGSWKDALLANHNIPADRIIFPGAISHDLLRQLYQISTAHLYLTYPFVLSWSVIEAMSCGALIIGSDTPPVREIIRSGQNGLLVPFFDTDALADTILRVLQKPNDFLPMRIAGRKTIEHRFRLTDCLSRQKSLINTVLNAA